jgi:hypothetical protein
LYFYDLAELITYRFEILSNILQRSATIGSFRGERAQARRLAKPFLGYLH